jgi:hypothetical protein
VEETIHGAVMSEECSENCCNESAAQLQCTCCCDLSMVAMVVQRDVAGGCHGSWRREQECNGGVVGE